MAVKVGDRYQQNFFPPSIEEYVAKNDPVRAYDAIIDTLPIAELGLKDRKSAVGNSNYSSKLMLKIFVYANSYGWQSNRKIAPAKNTWDNFFLSDNYVSEDFMELKKCNTRE